MPKTVLVCRKCKHQDCLVDVLGAHANVSIQRVRCQKICDGPVVGLQVGGQMEWFERVRSLKEIAALVHLTRKKHSSAIPKPLRKRRVKSFAGRQPRM
ncbi:MAG: hypothetical protein ABW033_07800 [Acidimicrobiia bacterium]